MGEENKVQDAQLGTEGTGSESGFSALYGNSPEGFEGNDTKDDVQTESSEDINTETDTDTDTGDVDKGVLNDTLNKLAEFLLGKEKGKESNEEDSSEEESSEEEAKDEVETFTKEDVQKMIAEALNAEKAKEENNSKLNEVKDEFKDFINYKLENDKDFDYTSFKESNPHYFNAEKKVSETKGEIYPVGRTPNQFERGFGKLFQ